MRDATRGGAAAVLNEAAEGAGWGMLVSEEAFPVLPDVRAAAEILGLSPLEIANEGVFIAVVAPAALRACLDALHACTLGRHACCIGEIMRESPGQVVLETRVGGRRNLDFPRGLLLPRIC